MSKASILGISVSCLILLSACVQTGPQRFEADFEEAARINTQLGMDYFSQGKIELAQSKFEKALEQDSNVARAHLGMAMIHAYYDEQSQAVDQFEKAQRQAPRDAEVLVQYAAFRCAHKDVESAEKLFAKAIALTRNPGLADTYSAAGRCQLEVGDWEQAESHLREALNLQPRHPQALLSMAELNYQKQDFLRARAFIQRYEAHHAETTKSLLWGLRVEHELGDQSTAQQYARRLRQRAPGIENRIDLMTGKAW